MAIWKVRRNMEMRFQKIFKYLKNIFSSDIIGKISLREKQNFFYFNYRPNIKKVINILTSRITKWFLTHQQDSFSPSVNWKFPGLSPTFSHIAVSLRFIEHIFGSVDFNNKCYYILQRN